MAKVHIGEKRLFGVPPNRTGQVDVFYHVNIDTQKRTALDVTPKTVDGEQVARIERPIQNIAQGQLRGAKLRLGNSAIESQLTTHPDFGATAEGTLLANQNIAEVEALISVTERETDAEIATKADGFYNTIEAAAQAAYTELFGNYGTTRNPIAVVR